MTLATKDTAKAVKVYLQKDDELWSAVHYAIQRSAGARHLSDEARRVIANSVLTALGQDFYGDDDFTYVGPDAELETAARRLLEYVPEFGYVKGLAELNADADLQYSKPTEEERSKYIEDQDEILNRGADGDPVPFLSQIVYYPLFAGGKEDGRSLNSRIRDLKTALGLDDR